MGLIRSAYQSLWLISVLNHHDLIFGLKDYRLSLILSMEEEDFLNLGAQPV